MIHQVTMTPRVSLVNRPTRMTMRIATRISASASPPTVSDTKAKFQASYRKTIPALYAGVVNELLVQQHIWRYNTRYQYDAVFALGFCSVFDQILEGFDETEKKAVFDAYVSSLGEDPAMYRADAARLSAAASTLSSAEALLASTSDNDVTRTMGEITSRVQKGSFLYTKWFAVGLFRLLELVGAKDPEALKKVVSSIGVRQEAVNKDLLMYKSILSKLAGAKEMMKEFLAREKKKLAEREAEKAAKAAST